MTLHKTTLNRLRLNKDADRRLYGGHLWIYSNEVATKQTPLKSFSAGEQVIVEDAKGKTVGVFVPINEWEKITIELKKMKSSKKSSVLNGIKKGMRQVQQIEKGKLKSISLKQLLDEL